MSSWAPEELYLMDLVEAGQAGGRASLNLIQQVRAEGGRVGQKSSIDAVAEPCCCAAEPSY